MDIDSQLDEWEGVVEDDLAIDEMGKKVVRDHTANHYDMCHSNFPSLFFFFSQFYCSAFGGSRKTACNAHGFYDAKPQKGSGPLLCHPLLTHILNGNPPAFRLAPRFNLTTLGRYLSWG